MAVSNLPAAGHRQPEVPSLLVEQRSLLVFQGDVVLEPVGFLEMVYSMIDADGNEHIPDPSARYELHYHRDGIAPKIMLAWDAIAISLIEHFRPDNAIDLGCSGGGLVRRLLVHGVAAIGVDGSKPAADVTKEILIHDLRIKDGIPWTTGTFDLVTSFDTAEHLEESAADTFSKLCAEAAKPGGWVVFGAAVPGQGGLGHIHLKSHEWWAGQLEAIGLVLDVSRTESLRAKIRSNPAHNEAWWVEKNLQVFRKPG